MHGRAYIVLHCILVTNNSLRLGVDGNWSTYAFLVGNNNPVNVLFSTTISEFWAIGPGGCPDKQGKSAQCDHWKLKATDPGQLNLNARRIVEAYILQASPKSGRAWARGSSDFLI